MHSEGNYHRSERATYGMGDNFYNLPIQQKANIQNLQRTQTDLQEKNKPIQKWAKDMNRYFTKEDIYEATNMKKLHHHWSLDKCKSKPQRDTISYQLQW